jgi:hypothetical protein
VALVVTFYESFFINDSPKMCKECHSAGEFTLAVVAHSAIQTPIGWKIWTALMLCPFSGAALSLR